jgi:hypothetical protein
MGNLLTAASRYEDCFTSINSNKFFHHMNFHPRSRPLVMSSLYSPMKSITFLR